jgi:hypothetical protein
VATTNGQPIDTDGDGLPDYVEDADGDGQVGATETDPSNVDTDGDELSDGVEVEVTGTDPLDPASKNHNQEYVRYSIAHPLWKSAQSSGTSVMTTEAKLLVARGVDALRLYVEVSTTEPSSTRPTYNDDLPNIDLFAWALRHERSHHLNWMRFWAPDDVPLNPRDGDYRDWDPDPYQRFYGDWLPDNQEYYLGAEAGPYSPTATDSHPTDGYTELRADHQRHNCNSVNAVVWPVGSADAQDWACPGNNWPQ